LFRHEFPLLLGSRSVRGIIALAGQSGNTTK
jgi:hypothetical protein